MKLAVSTAVVVSIVFLMALSLFLDAKRHPGLFPLAQDTGGGNGSDSGAEGEPDREKMPTPEGFRGPTGQPFIIGPKADPPNY